MLRRSSVFTTASSGRRASAETPLANVYIAGEETDFCWMRHRKIVELDGPQYHQFPSHDARKQAKWEAAGFEVERIATDDVYHHAHRLLAAAPPPGPRQSARTDV